MGVLVVDARRPEVVVVSSKVFQGTAVVDVVVGFDPFPTKNVASPAVNESLEGVLLRSVGTSDVSALDQMWLVTFFDKLVPLGRQSKEMRHIRDAPLVSPSMLGAVVPGGQHHAVRFKGLVDVNLHVFTVHIAVACFLEPGALIVPESEIMRPPGLVAVATSKHHGSARAGSEAGAHLCGGHELVVLAEGLEGVEGGPTVNITSGPVLEYLGSGRVSSNADTDVHDVCLLGSGTGDAVHLALGGGGGVGGMPDQSGTVGDEDVAIGREAVQRCVVELAKAWAVVCVVHSEGGLDHGQDGEQANDHCEERGR